MSRIAYVNGRYGPHARAAVHVEDRGYQLADGVYEVCEVVAGRLVDERLHLARLDRSLRELRIRWPMAPAALVTQPTKLSEPYCAKAVGASRMPDPIMVPTTNAQHVQKPKGLVDSVVLFTSPLPSAPLN